MLKIICLAFLILILPYELIAQSDVEIGQYIYISRPHISRPKGKTEPNNQTVILISVNTNGQVTSANTVKGHPLLRAVSEQAARETKFTPTKINGKPVAATGSIIFEFEYFKAKSFAIKLCPAEKNCEAEIQRGSFEKMVYAGIINDTQVAGY